LTPALNILGCGPKAVLVELPAGSTAHVANFLREANEEIRQAVPAHDTVLLEFVGGRPADEQVLALLDEALSQPVAAEDSKLVEIKVSYDGEDLAEVGLATGMSPEAVATLHSEAVYAAAFCGFAPGFAYLTGLPSELHLPRREKPRDRVPRGSVAIAGEYSGVYPSASPGGWHLLGNSAVTLFDPDRADPALIGPGDRVRFVR
jgi:KipI family sensor histidine kinase inhibitor